MFWIVSAVIAVGPDANGLATLRHLGAQTGIAHMARLSAYGMRDLAAEARGLPPVYLPLAGPPGSPAVMATEECLPGYEALLVLPGGDLVGTAGVPALTGA